MRTVTRLVTLLAFGMLAGCYEVTLKDVSHEPTNRPLVGNRYEVIGRVDAYGIRDHSKADVEYVTLIPPPGIEGYEVGFRVPLEAGSKITINKVMKTNRWFESNSAFIVRVDDPSLPDVVEARIELFRGNEGPGPLDLNPAIYREIPKEPAANAGP